jgi:raffinose/stachyose/melibiose transport system permease protein
MSKLSAGKIKKERISPVIYLMTIPAFILFFVFHTFPALQGIFYSFTNWNGLNPSYKMVGFKNYIDLLHDSNILSTYTFTFKFAILSTVLVNVLSLILALGLNAKIYARNFFRAVYFLPNVLSVIIISFIFKYIFANILPLVGKALQIAWLSRNILGTREYAWIGVVFVAVWQSAALNTILYISGLQTVPEELYESSAIDGASPWQNFWHITFPIIAPFFTINMVLAMKNFLMVFDHIMGLTGGGPGNATRSISILIFQSGIAENEFAYQSANAVVYMIFIMAISLIQIRFLQKREMKYE